MSEAITKATDEQIRKTVESIQDPDTVHAFHNGYYTLTPDELRRAILALRPAVEPMTPEQVGKAYYLAQDKKGHEPTFVDGIAAAEAHHFGFDRIAQLEAK